MSWQLVLVNLWLRLTEKPYMARETDVAAARARMEAQAARFPMPEGVVPVPGPLTAGERSIPALRIAGAGSGVLLWLHGGAYCMGSPHTHAAMVAAIARRTGLAAVLPDYRLAPEHPFPAAVEDARAAWEALLAEGVAPGRIVLGGDSAGGGLALAVLHDLLAGAMAPPAALVVFSPWTDLSLSGASLTEMARRDVLLPASRIPEARDQYLDGADPRDPRASPLFGTFAGGPPVLIQTSRAEVLRDDSVMLAERLRGQGVAVDLDLWDRTPHVWQCFQGSLPEADAALDGTAAFIARTMQWQG